MSKMSVGPQHLSHDQGVEEVERHDVALVDLAFESFRGPDVPFRGVRGLAVPDDVPCPLT